MAKKKTSGSIKHDPAEARGKDAKMPRAHAGHFDPLKALVKKSEKGVKTRGLGGAKAAHGAKVKAQAKALKSLPTKPKKKKKK